MSADATMCRLMNYPQWLSQYVGEDTARGDLADDFERDPNIKQCVTFEDFDLHLEKNWAGTAVRVTLRETWSEAVASGTLIPVPGGLTTTPTEYDDSRCVWYGRDSLLQMNKPMEVCNRIVEGGMTDLLRSSVLPDDGDPYFFQANGTPEEGMRARRVEAHCAWFVTGNDGEPRDRVDARYAVLASIYEAGQQLPDHQIPPTCLRIMNGLGGATICPDCTWKARIVTPVQLQSKELTLTAPVARAIAWSAVMEAKQDHGVVLSPDIVSCLLVLESQNRSEFARVLQHLRKDKVPVRPLEKAIKSAREEIEARPVEQSDDRRDVSVLLEEPPADDLRVPEGFTLDRNGTYQLVPTENGIERRPVASSPILITGSMFDSETAQTYLHLAWLVNGEWKRRVVPRGDVAEVRRLLTLADFDFPVASDNAIRLVAYLRAFEDENRSRLPELALSGSLGWQDRSCRGGFLWGQNLLTAGGRGEVLIDLHDSDPATWPAGGIAFHSTDPGASQLVLGYRREGSWEGWLEAIGEVVAFPRVLLMVYAAFAPPLIPIVRAENFVMDVSNRTSTGKTSALRAGASVWGCPFESMGNGIVHSWDATRVWLERAAAVQCHLPTFVDDTKRAKYPNMVGDIIYTYCQGRGRGRGSKTGFAATGTWSGMLGSTGEAPATSFTQAGGVRARVISVVGLPFGNDDATARAVVERLNAGVALHHGHAGPRFVQWLQRNFGHYSAIRKRYRRHVEQYAASASSGPAGRMARHAGVVALAAELAHHALKLPWDYRDPFADLWPGIVGRAEEADMALRALDYVLSWAVARQGLFAGRVVKFNEPNEYAGRWDQNGGYLGLFKHILYRILTEGGFVPEEVLASWFERGFLDVDREKSGSRRTKRVQVAGQDTRLYCLKPEVVENWLGDADDSGEKTGITGDRWENNLDDIMP